MKSYHWMIFIIIMVVLGLMYASTYKQQAKMNIEKLDDSEESISLEPNDPDVMYLEPNYEFTISVPEYYSDLVINIDGDEVEINYDPNTNTLSSDRAADDTFKLLYFGISMMPGSMLRVPKDWNEPINVKFAEDSNYEDSK